MEQDSSNQAEAQHYIPKFYLKGFTDRRGLLWVHEKFKPPKSSTPKAEANRPDYYTHAENEGRRDRTAEDILKVIESRVAPVICKLANPQYILTPVHAGNLIVFVAFMFARVPSWREHLDTFAAEILRDHQLKLAADKERFYKTISSFENAEGKPLGMDREKLREWILKGEYEIQQKSAAFNLGAMIRSGLSIVEVLKEFGYEGLYAPRGKFFITSDSPVHTIRPDAAGKATVGMGFAWPGVEVYFPLNKRTCLRLKRGLVPKGRFVEPGHVDQINRVVMMTATNFIYSNERFRRLSRLFDEHGCKVRPGKESFLTKPPAELGIPQK